MRRLVMTAPRSILERIQAVCWSSPVELDVQTPYGMENKPCHGQVMFSYFELFCAELQEIISVLRPQLQCARNQAFSAHWT